MQQTFTDCFALCQARCLRCIEQQDAFEQHSVRDTGSVIG